MKLKKLLEQFETLIDAEKHKRRKRIEKTESIVQQLNQHAERLSKSLSNEVDTEKRSRIKTRLKVIKAQQKKGKDTLQTLKTGLKHG